MLRSMLLLIVLGSLSVPVAEAAPRAERFVIDAQYRGLVRKNFPEIGTAGLSFATEAGGAFRVSGSGRVVHPQDNSKVFEVTLDMRFRVRGGRVESVTSQNSCSRGSEELRASIERLLPFIYLVQHLPAPQGKRHALGTPGGACTMVYGGSAARPEVVVMSGSAQLGKFFLSRAGAGPVRLERFRVPGKGSVSLQFTSATPAVASVD